MARNEDVEKIATELGSTVAAKVTHAILEDRQRMYYALLDNFYGSKGEKRDNFAKLNDNELLSIFQKIAWNEQPH
jgi:hypothetical protein